MAQVSFTADNFEIYQLNYYPESNLCSSIEKFPTPDRVKRIYDPAGRQETIQVYWLLDDYKEPNIRQNECAKFVIRRRNGRYKGDAGHNYTIASHAFVNRHYTHENRLEFSVTFECDIPPVADDLGLKEFVCMYRVITSYVCKHRYRLKNSTTYTETESIMCYYGKQILINEIYYNEPNTTVKWNDGTITTVGCSDKDSFDKEIGLAVAIAEKYLESVGYFHPRAALKSLAKRGHDQTEKTQARKAFKAAKKNPNENQDKKESNESPFTRIVNNLDQIRNVPVESTKHTFEQLINGLKQVKNDPDEKEE